VYIGPQSGSPALTIAIQQGQQQGSAIVPLQPGELPPGPYQFTAVFGPTTLTANLTVQ
jgi:hypothetical protein